MGSTRRSRCANAPASSRSSATRWRASVLPPLATRMAPPMDLARALEVAIAAAREAGELLRADFHRPGGPRGGGDKAEADLEAEHAIRRRLADAVPDRSYLCEATGRSNGRPDAPVWLVDPNDGTRDYLVGRRGSAVSIGLLASGRPSLGVVYAFGYPDDAGDLFVWAEG